MTAKRNEVKWVRDDRKEVGKGERTVKWKEVKQVRDNLKEEGGETGLGLL